MLKFFKCSKNVCTSKFGPTYKSLQFWGLIKQNHRKLYKVAHSCALIVVVTQYIELWLIRKDLGSAMRNLSITMLSTMCAFKGGIYVFYEQSWLEIFKYVSDLERKQLSNKDPLTEFIIAKYVTFSNRVTCLYKVLVTSTVILVILTPIFTYISLSSEYKDTTKNGSIPYPDILSSWVPFDKTKGIGYWVTATQHIVMCIYGASVVANFDCNAVLIMWFFVGQLSLLRMNCDRLFSSSDSNVIYKEALKRIKHCHHHHLDIMKFSSLLNNLLSPVMFLYVVICSLVICASAIQLTTDISGSIMMRIWVTEYLIATISQLFLYCWHCNQVSYMSNEVDRGIYSSMWYKQNTRVRRSLLILGVQLRKSIVFTAGPFTKLNIATFLAILECSYNYYTLLNNKR